MVAEKGWAGKSQYVKGFPTQSGEHREGANPATKFAVGGDRGCPQHGHHLLASFSTYWVSIKELTVWLTSVELEITPLFFNTSPAAVITAR